MQTKEGRLPGERDSYTKNMKIPWELAEKEMGVGVKTPDKGSSLGKGREGHGPSGKGKTVHCVWNRQVKDEIKSINRDSQNGQKHLKLFSRTTG